jgi:hypothetical protein
MTPGHGTVRHWSERGFAPMLTGQWEASRHGHAQAAGTVPSTVAQPDARSQIGRETVKAIGRTFFGQQNAGGLAALYLAAAYLLAMPFFLLLVDYQSAVDPAAKVASLVTNHGAMQVMYLITYVVFGIALSILALALYERLKPAAPALMQTATAVGLIWAVLLIASGLVFNAGMGAVVTLYPANPAQAVSMWQAIEPVSNGLSSTDGEILGGLWVLLVSIAGLRGGGFSRAFGWFGMAVGAIGLASVIPPLKDGAILFGLVQIGWFVWLGFSMLRQNRGAERVLVAGAQPA